MSSRMASCIFCKIIKGTYSFASLLNLALKLFAMSTLMAYITLIPFDLGTDHLLGDIPCFKLYESDKTLAFLDINPLSRGHAVCAPSRAPTLFQISTFLTHMDLRIAGHSQVPRREACRHPR